MAIEGCCTFRQVRHRLKEPLVYWMNARSEPNVTKPGCGFPVQKKGDSDGFANFHGRVKAGKHDDFCVSAYAVSDPVEFLNSVCQVKS